MYGGRESSTCCNFRTHANSKSTSKSRKHFHHFDSRWCKCSQHKQIKKHRKCSQHNQIHFICSAFLFWWCCEHLQRVRCQIDESVFLICRCFFLFAAHFFFWLYCEHLQRVCCQIDESVFLICRCFFLFAARFLFWLCCEHLQRVRCQIDESVFLICRYFFLFAAR